MLTDGRTDRRMDRRTVGHHQSISRNCFAIRPIKMKSCVSLSSNLPRVIDRSNLSPRSFAAR